MALAKRTAVNSEIESGTNDADDEVIVDSQAALLILESDPLGDDDYNPIQGIRNGVLIGATLWLIGIISTFAILRW